MPRWDGSDVHFPLRMPGIISGLHPEPDRGAVAEHLAKAGGDAVAERIFGLRVCGHREVGVAEEMSLGSCNEGCDPKCTPRNWH